MGKQADKTRIIDQRDQLQRMTRRKIRLEVISGPDQGTSLIASENVVQIGSQQGNSLRLHDPAISRIHFEMRSVRDGIRIRDLGSTNGTWIHGLRLDEGTISRRTTITVGQSKIVVESIDEEVSEILSARDRFGAMVGKSPAIRKVFALLEQVAPTDETVLILGETGTGKELCARAIMEASPRRNHAFVIVDCGALPPSLLESELFGHVRGAFTDAKRDHQGAFERANGGTVFLDEIGELPLAFQTRLLRVVENRTIRRVGSSQTRPLDIRIIAATNRPLEQEVNRGTFRADLYYRLSVMQVHLPPLRERPDDIVILAKHLLNEASNDASAVPSDDELEELKKHLWPGNVRELRNYLSRMAFSNADLLSTGASIDAAGKNFDFDCSFKDLKEREVEKFEKAYLSLLLEKTAGNVSKAARIAQTDRTYLSKLLQKHGLRS